MHGRAESARCHAPLEEEVPRRKVKSFKRSTPTPPRLGYPAAAGARPPEWDRKPPSVQPRSRWEGREEGAWRPWPSNDAFITKDSKGLDGALNGTTSEVALSQMSRAAQASKGGLHRHSLGESVEPAFVVDSTVCVGGPGLFSFRGSI